MDAQLPVPFPPAAATIPAQNGDITLNPAEGAQPLHEAQAITQDEVDLYDRQIRLWGLQAQENIRKANILLLNIKALANEIAKNLVLAGVGSLTILDHEDVTEEDLETQFFVARDDIGKKRAEVAGPRIQKLNSRVKVTVDTSGIAQRLGPKQSDDLIAFLRPFDVIIAADVDYPTLKLLNAASQIAQCKFYACGIYGYYGYIFVDLIKHEYVVERVKSNMPTKIGPESASRTVLGATSKKGDDGKMMEIVSKEEKYSHISLANTSPLPAEILNNRRSKARVSPFLACLRALWEFEEQKGRKPDADSEADGKNFQQLAAIKQAELQLPHDLLPAAFIYQFLRDLPYAEVPVAAFLGGQAAQDIINVLGKRQQPIQNFLLFDGIEMLGPVYALHPIIDTMPTKTNGGVVPLVVPMANGAAMIID